MTGWNKGQENSLNKPLRRFAGMVCHFNSGVSYLAGILPKENVNASHLLFNQSNYRRTNIRDLNPEVVSNILPQGIVSQAPRYFIVSYNIGQGFIVFKVIKITTQTLDAPVLKITYDAAP